ncbi:unnamed protein product [Rotaria sordida]|nr:unnamed protein product [Rotaria sordida]
MSKKQANGESTFFSASKVSPLTESQQRAPCRLDWVESSWTRWIQIPLFLWVSPILSLANKRNLIENDLNDLSIDDKCSVVLNRVNQYNSKWPARISQPLLIRELTLYIKDQSGLPAYSGYLYAISLCIAVILQATCLQQIIFRNTRAGTRIRNALSTIIYQYLLTINTAALHKTTAAQTINLVSNDANKFAELSIFIHALVMVPLEVFGNLVGVKGAIGSGKSTLLASILGEINLISGKLQLQTNSISYAPQSAWIFADTIRGNILLGKPMDEERYKNVIKACCLDIDLQNFGEVGDLLMIGDKGVNLSGGQKARISLARALYADADLYLLDDPLAAVDPKVAKSIFDQSIGPQSFLHGKTRILVTHQTHFLVESDQMLLMTNGHIDELHIEQQSAIESSNETTETDSSNDKETDFVLNTSITDINSIVKSETSVEGSINWNVWIKLFTSPPLRWYGFLLMIILMFGNEALYDYANNWLALWSSKNKSEQRSSFYIYVYLGVIFSILIVALIRVGYVIYIMLCGATYFHNRMLKGILYTSLRFFENNPSGRILNRASKDQQVIDELLPLALIDTMQYLLMTLGSIVIIGITNPWVLLILVPLIPTILWLRRFYMRSSRQLKRLESVTRSPIYTLFSTSLDGLTSIRAFDVQSDFLKMFIERIDANSRAYFILSATAHWFGLRLDIMASLLTLATSILAVALRYQINPSTAALSISYCITLTGLFQWAVRQSAEAENFMTSAERIYEYGQLVRESHQNNNDSNILIQPDNDWPSRGIIEFKDYTFRYRPELDPVLKNLNIRIESQEKIGVIGRTGAGKSSLIQALFRLVDQSAINGTILIDGIDIGRLSLNYLRSHLSVIPQVPILFCGTLRYNVDPFEQFSDEECFAVLEAVQLKKLIRNHPDGLHLLVAESGTNLSAGERQLICVARAILKRSKILLIDEATAHVDHATDTMIQEVIADKFRDRTILTIAHRLNTVANSDRILMLQQGEVAYFDVPSETNLITVERWCKRFREGHEELENKVRPGRPVTETTPENIEQVRPIIEDDPSVTKEEVDEFDSFETNRISVISMDPIFAIDVETIFSPYGAKYINEIESLTQTIEICLAEGFIHSNKNKEILISSLKKRININCIIEKYQYVIDDIEILQQFDVDIYMDIDLFLAWIEARMGLHHQTTINEFEIAQNKYAHDFKSIIRNLKAFNIKKLFER